MLKKRYSLTFLEYRFYLIRRRRTMHDETQKIEKAFVEKEDSNQDKDIFAVEEIQIEEMAIDGICGVY
jgi:mycofactocin precursor